MTIAGAPDVRAQVRGGKMSAFQVMAVTICMIINMLDGFDVLAIAFTGPKIAKDWALDPQHLGLLFSSGLVGMMVGSILLSPLADKFGRRFATLFGLALISGGMLASAYTHDLWQLGGVRIVTGLGIGTLLSSINTIVVEYSSAKRQDFAVAFMAVGYPIGATLGGMVAIYLIKAYGWPAVFTFGGIVSIVMIPIVLFALPESLDFLLLKRPKNALSRINLLLRRIGRPPIAALPAIAETKQEARAAASAWRLFDKTFLMRTLTITTAYFFVVMSFYFMLNWTPKVLVDQGLDLSTGISGAVLINVGGVFGGLLLGWFTHKFGLIRLASLYMFLVFVGMTAFGFVHDNLPLLAALAVFTGFFMIGSIVSLYAITGTAYPVQVRNTGTGFVIGGGRAGGILGPYIGGLLIAAGWTKPEYTLALAIPSAIAALVILMVSLNDAAPSAARVPARA